MGKCYYLDPFSSIFQSFTKFFAAIQNCVWFFWHTCKHSHQSTVHAGKEGEEMCCILTQYCALSIVVVPNHCSGDHKCSASSSEVLPEKFEIHNMLCFKMKFDSRYEGFSDNILKGWETLVYWLT